MKQKNWYLLIILAGLLACLYFYKKKSDELLIPIDIISNVKMRKFIHNKLWRDKGPVRMEATGSIVHVTILDDEQYVQQLGLKLKEEADEVHTAKNKEDLMNEIADVFEVLDAIMKHHDFSRDEILEIQKAKRDERGGLFERKFVTMTESIPGSFLDEYCSQDPEKYKQVIE